MDLQVDDPFHCHESKSVSIDEIESRGIRQDGSWSRHRSLPRASMAGTGRIGKPVALRWILCVLSAFTIALSSPAGAKDVGTPMTKEVSSNGVTSSGDLKSFPTPRLTPTTSNHTLFEPLRSASHTLPLNQSSSSVFPAASPLPPPASTHLKAPLLSHPASGVQPNLVVVQQPLVHNPVSASEGSASPAAEYSESGNYDSELAPVGPLYFATENSTTVTAQIGSTALVPCVVRNIGDGMVSWIRRKDYHLLTVGLTTYSSDERYSAVHAQHSEDWTLQIKYVQERDAGLYECQVSSHPPTSIFIDLRVVEARADIIGPSEKYLKSGSMLRLACVLRQSTEPPIYVFWYHNNRMINYDRDRGVNVTSPVIASSAVGGGQQVATIGLDGNDDSEDGVSVTGDDGIGPEEEHASTLVIASAQKAHSGNYSCVPNNAQPASTYVHILNAGENPAAMQHGGRGLSWLRCPSAWLLAACLFASLSPSWPGRDSKRATGRRYWSSCLSLTAGSRPPSRLRHPGHSEPSWKRRRKNVVGHKTARSATPEAAASLVTSVA